MKKTKTKVNERMMGNAQGGRKSALEAAQPSDLIRAVCDLEELRACTKALDEQEAALFAELREADVSCQTVHARGSALLSSIQREKRLCKVKITNLTEIVNQGVQGGRTEKACMSLGGMCDEAMHP